MSNTDVTVINEILTQRKAEQDPAASDSEFWEFFSAEQILRDFQLDPDEIKSGLVGQESQNTPGNDGGIDSMYLLVNGKLIRDLDQAKALTSHKQHILFDIIIIQSKKGKGFGLEALNRLSNTSESIFQIDKQPSDFKEQYNEPLLDIIRCFRAAHTALIVRHPEIRVYFYYAACADSSNIHPDIKGKAEELEAKIPRILSTIKTCKVDFIGARDMIDRFRKPPKSSFKLKCLNSISDTKGGYIALVELSEYFTLITEGGALREYLFESNVRDYEGDVEVNKQIRNTLEVPDDKAGFWWLNNGITILADKVGGHTLELVIDEPRIVNGLQTSQEIFDYLRRPILGMTGSKDNRHAVIRIIESPDEALQDKIIRATNSQTKIPIQYLRASDEIQRDIEQVFRSKGMHYDRRKNSWRKANRSLDQVLGVTELAQSVAAVILQEPDHARARPSRYFKAKDGLYEKIFTAARPLQTYVVCALLRKRVEVFLKTVESDKKDRNNLLFYVLMTAARRLTAKTGTKNPPSIADIDVATVSDTVFREALSIVRPVYENYGSTDTAAKGTEMLTDLKAILKARFSKKKKSANLEGVGTD